MSRPKDFADDLADVSATVNTDVDAIIKLVRQKDAREGESQQQVAQSHEEADSPSTTKAQAPAPKATSRRPSRIRAANNPSLVEQVVLENVTTRLHRDTNELLTEAALRQKLKKETPATRQDIIEAALQDWFRRHGYAL
jgi:hypothetical protein